MTAIPAKTETVSVVADASRATGQDEEAEPPQRLTLDVVVMSDDWAAAGSEKSLVALVEAAANVMAAAPELERQLAGSAMACVAFSSDASVQVLNAQYRGKDAPTNVLSFSAPAPKRRGRVKAATPRVLGDVVLADGTVLGEAEALAIPAGHHIQHLVVHGTLHLLGFDHESDAEAEAMEALERLLLARLGVADPYRLRE